MVFDLFRGASYLARGLRALRQPGVRRYAVAPVGISITLFSALVISAYYGFEWLMAQLLPEGYEWLQWLLWPLFALSILLILVYGFTLVANLAAAPFNGALSAAVERNYKGVLEHTGGQSLFKETTAAIGNEIQRIFYYLIRALPLLILFLIPVVNLVAPWLWILFSAWVLGMEYAAHAFENRSIRFRDQRRILRQRPLLMLGFGAIVLFATMVPILNFFIMPAAVAGATLLYLDHFHTDR